MHSPLPLRAAIRRPSLVALLMLLALLLAACGGAATTDGAVEGGSETAAASGAFVCPEPNPKLEVTSKTVNLFVWTEYIPQEIIDCFEEVYGVTVNRDEYSSNEEMYAKLAAGGSSYDLAQPTDYIVPLMIRQGLLQELDHERLPVLDGFDTSYLDFEFDPGNRYSIPWQAGAEAIAVNTDRVETMPTSWADLWNAEYAGRLVSLDDSRAVIGLTLMTLGYDINTTDPAQLQEAKAKLAQLVPNIKLFDSDSPKTALIAGDVDLGLVWSAEAFLAQRENPAIDFVYPAEGTILWQDNWVLLEGAPNADAAYAWMNYAMQPDLFWLMLRDFPYTMPSRATLEYAQANQTELYDIYMGSDITNTPAEVVESGVRVKDVGEALTLFDDIWTEVKSQ